MTDATVNTSTFYWKNTTIFYQSGTCDEHNKYPLRIQIDSYYLQLLIDPYIRYNIMQIIMRQTSASFPMI